MIMDCWVTYVSSVASLAACYEASHYYIYGSSFVHNELVQFWLGDRRRGGIQLLSLFGYKILQ